jgi:hypothetical protein
LTFTLSELVIPFWTIENPQQGVAFLVTLVYVLVDDLLLSLLVCSSAGFHAFQAEIHKVSRVRFPSAAHADVSCLIVTASSTSIAHKSCFTAFFLCLRLQI